MTNNPTMLITKLTVFQTNPQNPHSRPAETRPAAKLRNHTRLHCRTRSVRGESVEGALVRTPAGRLHDRWQAKGIREREQIRFGCHTPSEGVHEIQLWPRCATIIEGNSES